METAVGLYGNGSKDFDKPVTIISYEAWLSLLENNKFLGSSIDLNINDESHTGLSFRRQNLVNEVLIETHHLGFTASSKYDADKTMQLTHRNLIYEINLKNAIERGMLSNYVHVQFAILRLLTQQKSTAHIRPSNADFTLLKRLEWAQFISHAYSQLLDGISGQPLSEKIAIFFAADTRHADALTKILNNNPVLREKARKDGFKSVAVSIHSVGQSNSQQERLQAEFEAGCYMAVVGDKKFKAGFDYPRVKLVASYPGSSAVDKVQELGRATRPYVDPISGEDQGAVILEAIPYVGDLNLDKDLRAKNHVLKEVVTANDILDGIVAFSQEHTPMV